MKKNYLSNVSQIAIIFLLLLVYSPVLGDTYNLVTDASTLAENDEILIVSEGRSVTTNISGTDYTATYGDQAMNTTPTGTRLSSDDVTISSSSISTTTATAFTLSGNSSGWKIYNGSDYLYADARNKLTLTTEASGLTFTIDINSTTGVATITTTKDDFAYNKTTDGPLVLRLYAASTNQSVANKYFVLYATTNTQSNYDVYIYKKASSCANKVTLTKGSTTNGTFDLDKANGEHDNCDANFVVHVSNIVPADGSKYCNGIDATGGNSTVTGPVEGVWTVTYTKDNNITSTITPTYATKTSYTVTWYNEGASIGTESVYSGDKVSALPSPNPTSSCSGEFIGWVKSDAVVADKSVTDAYTTQPTAPTLFTDKAGSPTITGNTAFHAVYRMRKPD